MQQDYAHLYMNDGNFEFQERLFDQMSGKTQRNIRVLQRIREVLLSSEIQQDMFTLIDLQGVHRDIFKKFGMLEVGIDRCIASLSEVFDEFTSIDITDIEKLERQMIEQEIFKRCMEKLRQ